VVIIAKANLTHWLDWKLGAPGVRIELRRIDDAEPAGS